MRLRIQLEASTSITLPIAHQDLLRGLLYRLLGESDVPYAQQVHDRGWGEGIRNLKLFTFSQLRVPLSRRRMAGDILRIAPGPVEWWVSSPVEDVLRHEVQGMLRAGGSIDIGGNRFYIRWVDAAPTPSFAESARFTCMTPIVASVPGDDGRSTPRYLVPQDGARFAEAIRANLLRKYSLLYEKAPADDRLTLTFAQDFLATHPGTKLVAIKGICVRGAFAPFRLEGSPELIRLAWEAGLGEKTGSGFGMIEVKS